MTYTNSCIPHGLRGVLPRACLPAGEAVATGQGVGPDLSYSLAAAVRVPPFTPSREGGECCPATISAFVNEWIGPSHKPAPVVRDFTFKAVIGEPSW